MKNLTRGVLCLALVLGTAAPSQAIICCLIDKIAECPAVRKMRNECRAKHAAKKMKAKKPLGHCLKELLGAPCDCCACQGDCN